jgi:hypothetical protein
MKNFPSQFIFSRNSSLIVLLQNHPDLFSIPYIQKLTTTKLTPFFHKKNLITMMFPPALLCIKSNSKPITVVLDSADKQRQATTLQDTPFQSPQALKSKHQQLPVPLKVQTQSQTSLKAKQQCSASLKARQKTPMTIKVRPSISTTLKSQPQISATLKIQPKFSFLLSTSTNLMHAIFGIWKF